MSDLKLEAAPAVEDQFQIPEPRLALLTNIIPPYNKAWLDLLSRKYQHVRIFLSAPMEANRSWNLAWEGLDVVVQKTLTLNRSWRHPQGFTEPLYVHVPIDTWSQLNRLQPDIVISWEMGWRTIAAALYRSLHRRTRLVVWAEIAEATEKGRGLLRGLVRSVLHRFVDAFLVTGKSGECYLRGVGVPAAKLHRISYSTDISHFLRVPLARSFESLRLLYVGQLIERKGLLPFLRALAAWASAHPDREVHFDLVGDGPLRQRLQEEPLPSNLKLTLRGNVPYESLPAVYAVSSIFVLPTLADTWAVVVNEAMAAGLPILGSIYAQSVTELVDEQSGWRFAPDNPAAMYTAIDRALNTRDNELHQMRNAARRVAAELTPARVLSMIESAIDACRADQLRSREGSHA